MTRLQLVELDQTLVWGTYYGDLFAIYAWLSHETLLCLSLFFVFFLHIVNKALKTFANSLTHRWNFAVITLSPLLFMQHRM